MEYKDKLILFDFDGVIVDSFDSVYKINKKAAEFVSKKISKKDYINFFKGKFHKNLHNHLQLNKDENKKFLQQKYNVFEGEYLKSGLFSFAPDMIEKLSKEASMAIISSAPSETIQKLLEINNLTKKFYNIFGMNKKGKVENIKKCMIDTSVDAKNTFFITDTIGDVRDAKKVGVKTIAVTWGFHNEDMLRDSNPDYIVHNYNEILDIVKDEK